MTAGLRAPFHISFALAPRGNSHETSRALLGGAAALPIAAQAQQPIRVRVIGVLNPYPESQAPVINGPMSQPAFRGMTGIGE